MSSLFCKKLYFWITFVEVKTSKLADLPTIKTNGPALDVYRYTVLGGVYYLWNMEVYSVESGALI